MCVEPTQHELGSFGELFERERERERESARNLRAAKGRDQYGFRSRSSYNLIGTYLSRSHLKGARTDVAMDHAIASILLASSRAGEEG